MREIEAVLIRHAEGGSLPEAEIGSIVRDREEASLPGLADFERSEDRMYLRRGETAYVPMHGTIVSRAGLIDRASGAVSPQSVQEKLRAASRDPQIGRIVLSVDSPGGTVNGTMATAETVQRVANEKEVVAVAENTMASAAYWIGSHASRVVVGESAEVGSIGVIAVHRDYTGKLEEEGVESTVLRFQEDKALGHPEEEFSDGARGQWEQRLSGYYDLFAEAVAGSRNIPETTVRQDIKSRSYLGREAVDIGLADAVGSLDAVLRQSPSTSKDNQFAMSNPNQQGQSEGPGGPAIEELRAQLEQERERADVAEAERQEALELAEKQSEALAAQREQRLKQEATSLIEDEIIASGKALPSQRDSLIEQCQSGGSFDRDRVDMVRTMYAGIAEGAAVPVSGSGASDGDTGRDLDESANEDPDLRESLVDNVPSRYRGEIG